MANLFTEEFELSRKKWEAAKKQLDSAVKLYKEAYSILKESQEDLEIKWKEFHSQEVQLETSNVIDFKPKEEE
jgi:exonuclease VII small subunit